MRVLVAIMSCWRRDYKVAENSRDWFDDIRHDIPPSHQRQACRETWIQELPKDWDYRFFMGDKFPNRGMAGYKAPEMANLVSDEVLLHVDDTYHGNGFKIHAMCKWALDHGYDYMLRADDDSYLWPKRLAELNFKSIDYMGNALPDGSDYGGVHAGFAVFMSRRLMELVVQATPDYRNWADDCWVAAIAKKNGIKANPVITIQTRLGPHPKKDYYIDVNKLPLKHDWAALHSAPPQIMRKIYEREHNGKVD